ncbi:hypothetical protein ABEV21_04450, partial [Geobacillus stearothermophilus]
ARGHQRPKTNRQASDLIEHPVQNETSPFHGKDPWAARFALHPGMKISRQSCIFTEKETILGYT